MLKARTVNLNEMGDERGKLVVLEEGVVPLSKFSRAFFIYDTGHGVVRGRHANRNSDFLLIAVAGSCKIKVDYGNDDVVFELSNPYTGVYIPKLIWKEMYDFSEDAVLLVLSNCKYDSTEYITDYSEYLSMLSN